MNSFIYCYFQYQIQTKKENFEKSFQFSNLKKNIFQTKKKSFSFPLFLLYSKHGRKKFHVLSINSKKKFFNIFGIVFFFGFLEVI